MEFLFSFKIKGILIITVKQMENNDSLCLLMILMLN